MSLQVMRCLGSSSQHLCISLAKGTGQNAGIDRRCMGEGEQQMHTHSSTHSCAIFCAKVVLTISLSVLKQ